MSERCQRCDTESPDLRTLWMACLYEMSEMGLPFHLLDVDKRKFYTLLVCKRCRADWMTAIQNWFQDRPDPEEEGIEAGAIYERHLGTNRRVQ